MNGLKPGVGSSGQQWKVAPKIPYMLGNRMGAESFAQCEGMEKVPKQAGISFAPCGAPPSYSHALAQNVWISCPCAPGFRPRGPDSAPSPNPTLLWVGELCGAALSISFVNVENGKWKMAAPSILSRSCVQTVAGLPSLGASLVKARVGNPFFARLELQGTHYGISQQLRRTLVVSPKQDVNTPLVSPNPPTPTCSYMEST